MERTLCFIFFFLIFFTLSKDAFCKSDKHKKHKKQESDDVKIVGGYDTSISDVPYQVFVMLQMGDSYYQCGGSIISRRYILTAAHCIQGKQRAYVRAGSTNSFSGGRQYQSSLMLSHPLYNSRTFDNDVALIRLEQDIDVNNQTTRIVQLPAAGTTIAPNTTIVISGWGDTSENGNTSPTLMAVKVPTVSQQECKKTYQSLTTRQFCAGVPEGGKDSCQGDSGGPAVGDSSGAQLGIVSFGYGCARPGQPGVYTNVAAVRDWIKRNSGV